jgi:signal transduction histidine kinase
MPAKTELIKLIEETNDSDLIDKLLQHLQTIQNKPETPTVFTALKTAHEEMTNLKAQKDKFFAIISYELGSPLNSLKSMADFVMMDIQEIDNPMVVESVKMLYAQIEKLQMQMSNLIEWANMEVKNYVFSPQVFAIREVLTTAVQQYQKAAQNKSISLHYEPSKSILVNGEQKLIQLAVNNLLANAIKFSRKGDSIEITTQVGNNQAIISVKDTGIGMGVAKIENIFNVSRKATQKGTANENGYGLGLITTKAILDLHQSQLQIKSEQGKGSTFSFHLSLAN